MCVGNDWQCHFPFPLRCVWAQEKPRRNGPAEVPADVKSSSGVVLHRITKVPAIGS